MATIMSLESNKQSADVGDHAAIVQVKGDNNTIACGITANDAIAICKEMVKGELALLQHEAYTKAETRFNNFSSAFVERLTKVECRLDSLKEPSMQFALNNALIGYIKSGKDETKESLIDALIDRTNADVDSEMSIIDEAIEALHKISDASVAFLALKVFALLVMPNTRDQFNETLAKLAPLIESVTHLTPLDTAYLKQINCGQQTFIAGGKSYDETLAAIYDLYYTGTLNMDAYRDTLNDFASTHHLKNDSMLLIAPTLTIGKEGCIKLMAISSQNLKERFRQAGKAHLEDWVDKLKKFAFPMNIENIKCHNASLVPNWTEAMAIMDRSSNINFIPTPVGLYIGAKKLSKVLSLEIPMTLFYEAY